MVSNDCKKLQLIYSADPQSRPRPVVIIIFAYVVRTSVHTFQNLAIQNKFQAKTMFTTGETVGLEEWIIDDSCLISTMVIKRLSKRNPSFIICNLHIIYEP